MSFEIGDQVMVNPNLVAEPYYGIGTIQRNEVGVVSRMGMTEGDIFINFPNHHGWRGRIDELVSVDGKTIKHNRYNNRPVSKIFERSK